MNTNLRSALIGASVTCALLFGYSFRPAPEVTAYTYRQFSTIETAKHSDVGFTRILVSDDGEQELAKHLKYFKAVTGMDIANNDKLIVDNINQYTTEGWELYTVTTGVQSYDEVGIFITRYLFRKPA
jgi:hypothetical protein